MTTTAAPSAARCCAIAAPMPFDAPVTTATLPASFCDMTIASSLVGFVPNGKNIGGRTGRVKRINVSLGTEMESQPCADGTPPRLRHRQSPGPCAEGLLAQGLRGHVAARSDRGHGDQPPEPLRRLRQQGRPVPQGARSLRRRGRRAYVREALGEPTARAAVERLLRGDRRLLTDPGNPRGCLAVQGALACGEAAEPIRRELVAPARAVEAALCERFERRRSEGDLPTEADPADLARYVATVMHGMAGPGGRRRRAATNSGRSPRLALRAWPG